MTNSEKQNFTVLDAYEAQIIRKLDNSYILFVYSGGALVYSGGALVYSGGAPKEFIAKKEQMYLFSEEKLKAGTWIACIMYKDKTTENGLLLCPMVAYTLRQFKSLMNTGGI